MFCVSAVVSLSSPLPGGQAFGMIAVGLTVAAAFAVGAYGTVSSRSDRRG
jgi:hypothetical protein